MIIKSSNELIKMMKALRFMAVLFFSASFLVAAENAPREKLLMDFGWQFYLGDAPDAGAQFDCPEFARLDKNRPDDDAQEAKNAPLRVDAAAVNLGKDVSFVQPNFDSANWRTLDLPHDWAVELPFDRHGDKDHGFKQIGTNFPTNSIGWYRRTFELPASDKGRANGVRHRRGADELLCRAPVAGRCVCVDGF